MNVQRKAGSGKPAPAETEKITLEKAVHAAADWFIESIAVLLGKTKVESSKAKTESRFRAKVGKFFQFFSRPVIIAGILCFVVLCGLAIRLIFGKRKGRDSI